MTVVMMGQMSLDNLVEKSEKKNEQDQVDVMRQEVYSKGKEIKNERSVIFREEDDDGRERVTEEEERVSIYLVTRHYVAYSQTIRRQMR